jgi:TRAP-type C4-dicarboxylate transport system permease small subunit
MNFLPYIKKIVFTVGHKINWISNSALVALTAVIYANVLFRLFRKPFEGAVEIIPFLSSLVISFAIANTTIQRGHIALDVVVSKLPIRIQKVIAGIVNLLGMGIFALMCYFTALSATNKWLNGEVTQGLEIPNYPIVYGISFSCFVVFLVLLIDVLETFTKSGRSYE